MKLYLVQHAEAKRKEEDPSRSLSDEGRCQIKKVAGYARDNLEIHVKQIIHSGKLRAEQTAQVLAYHLSDSREILTSDNLAPLDDPSIWADRLSDQSENLMLVGHLPHLSKLASLLLTQDQDKEVVKFYNSGIVCLERRENGYWQIQWLLSPKIIS